MGLMIRAQIRIVYGMIEDMVVKYFWSACGYWCVLRHLSSPAKLRKPPLQPHLHPGIFWT